MHGFDRGKEIVTSYESLLFSASTRRPYPFNQGCALNCYVPMAFRQRALVEFVNESTDNHTQFFYIDYEQTEESPEDCGYFHSEFRRTNHFRGWGPEIASNAAGSHLANTANKGRLAWD